MAESWKKLNTSNLFSSFIVSSNRNRSAVVRELLCNKSLFVGQLYEDRSLALRAGDLISFTTDLQTLLELIYFLIIVSNIKCIIHKTMKYITIFDTKPKEAYETLYL